VADDELLKEIGDGSGRDADASVFEGQGGIAFVLVGIVKIRDASRGNGAEDVGIIRLPAAIVSLTDDRVRDRVAEARGLTAGSFIEITRILVEDGGKKGGSDESAAGDIGIIGTESLPISCRALAVFPEMTLRLLDSGCSTNDHDGERIDQSAQG